MNRRTACVRFRPSGNVVDVERGSFLTAAAVRAGESIVHDCDGQGVCSTCRVRIDVGGEAFDPVTEAERLQLGSDVEEGWRLCCVLRVRDDCEVSVPAPGFAYPPALQREPPPKPRRFR